MVGVSGGKDYLLGWGRDDELREEKKKGIS